MSTKDAAAHELPTGLPLPPVDRRGEPLKVGDLVTILSVESCASGLADDGQVRLRALVDQRRRILDLDRWGFAWLSFEADSGDPGFCLFPNELSLVGAHG